VPRWFGLGAKAEELFDTFHKINELGGQPGEGRGDAESKNFNWMPVFTAMTLKRRIT
jgi:hypothetical protein